MPKFTSFSRKEIQDLFKKASFLLGNKYLTILGVEISDFAANSHVGRILIVTPRKMGNAPQRNLMRRRLKSIFYEEQLYKKPYVLIVFCKKNSNLLPFDVLKEQLCAAYQKFNN